MLIDSQETTIVSSLGWVDGGALWIRDLAAGRSQTVRISDAKFLGLHRGHHDHFSVFHHYDGSRVAVTAHSFARPEHVLAKQEISHDRVRTIGQSDVWGLVPRYYTAFLDQGSVRDFVFITISSSDRPNVQQFLWYDDTYDKGYQGIVGVTEVPGSELVIISVQRSSRLILYDPKSRTKVGEIGLSNRHGNPSLFFRQTANELWADDYDTLLKIRPRTWDILAERRLQGHVAGARAFIGSFAFDLDETVCAVARPYSGDVVGIDPDSFQVLYHAELGLQPLDVAVLRNRAVVARSWTTGAVLSGTLKRIGSN